MQSPYWEYSAFLTFNNVEIGAEEEDVKELREKLENLNLIRE